MQTIIHDECELIFLIIGSVREHRCFCPKFYTFIRHWFFHLHNYKKMSLFCSNHILYIYFYSRPFRILDHWKYYKALHLIVWEQTSYWRLLIWERRNNERKPYYNNIKFEISWNYPSKYNLFSKLIPKGSCVAQAKIMLNYWNIISKNKHWRCLTKSSTVWEFSQRRLKPWSKLSQALSNSKGLSIAFILKSKITEH